MASSVTQEIENCIDKLRQGQLTEQDLRRVVEVQNGGSKRQDLLYLQAKKTLVASEVVGMAIVENDQVSDGPPDPDDWPYQTVLDAVRDGWRIIKFPEMALLLHEERTYGLGCEFILEKWR